MPIITLTTDFGSQSHFVAELKGKLTQTLPLSTIVDISHSITPFDLTETAFILKNSIFHFPKNTVHAVGVDSSLDIYKSIIIAKKRDQFLITADNGIVSMVFDNGDYTYKRIEDPGGDYFSFKNSFPHYIKTLIDHSFDLDLMDGLTDGLFMRSLQKPVYTDNIISFNILYLDAFGNAYTNLTKDFFFNIIGNKNFKICLSRFEFVDRISNSYSDVNEGGKVCFFDENGFMVIAINRDRADQLLGLRRDSNQLVVEIYDY